MTYKDAYLLLDSLSKHQIISSVDGLGAAVDSLKKHKVTVLETYKDGGLSRDYKVGSLSGGKDVYVGVKAWAIGRGGYSLSVALYLKDRNNGTILPLGGVDVRRWGMPYNTNPSDPRNGLNYAHLHEDVQSFIKALRVYEFKDRWVAFFAAQEFYDEEIGYKHIYRIFVIPKAKEGEEGWFEPYMIVWDVQGVKEKLYDTMFKVALNESEDKLYFIIVAGIGEGGKKGYLNVGYVDEVKKRLYGYIDKIDISWDPKDKGRLELVSLGDDQ